jgi:hypothetical protein
VFEEDGEIGHEASKKTVPATATRGATLPSRTALARGKFSLSRGAGTFAASKIGAVGVSPGKTIMRMVMQSEAQTVARLRSMVFLIEEALRLADEGDDPLLGAKLSDCIDSIEAVLSARTADALPDTTID